MNATTQWMWMSVRWMSHPPKTHMKIDVNSFVRWMTHPNTHVKRGTNTCIAFIIISCDLVFEDCTISGRKWHKGLKGLRGVSVTLLWCRYVRKIALWSLSDRLWQREISRLSWPYLFQNWAKLSFCTRRYFKFGHNYDAATWWNTWVEPIYYKSDYLVIFRFSLTPNVFSLIKSSSRSISMGQLLDLSMGFIHKTRSSKQKKKEKREGRWQCIQYLVNSVVAILLIRIRLYIFGYCNGIRGDEGFGFSKD